MHYLEFLDFLYSECLNNLQQEKVMEREVKWGTGGYRCAVCIRGRKGGGRELEGE